MTTPVRDGADIKNIVLCKNSKKRSLFPVKMVFCILHRFGIHNFWLLSYAVLCCIFSYHALVINSADVYIVPICCLCLCVTGCKGWKIDPKNH